MASLGKMENYSKVLKKLAPAVDCGKIPSIAFEQNMRWISNMSLV
jgi:hypothetical protein